MHFRRMRDQPGLAFRRQSSSLSFQPLPGLCYISSAVFNVLTDVLQQQQLVVLLSSGTKRGMLEDSKSKQQSVLRRRADEAYHIPTGRTFFASFLRCREHQAACAFLFLSLVFSDNL